MKRFVSVVIIALLLNIVFNVTTISSNIIENTSSGSTLYVGGTGSGNYSSIQDAIDSSRENDTIFVYSGTYKENIKIGVKNITLIGEKMDTTIIKAGFQNTAITISSNYATIKGFTIKNNLNGIIVNQKNHNKIIENKIINNLRSAISLKAPPGRSCKFNIIKKNIISDSIYGIYCSTQAMHGSSPSITNNEITNNDISKNIIGYSESVFGNIIKKNNFKRNIIHFTFLPLGGGVCPSYNGDTELDGNYWDRCRFLPKIAYLSFNGILVVDKNPAKEPFDI